MKALSVVNPKKIEMRNENDVVLAVDDKATNLVLLTGMLESEGYQVVTATDGVQAWETLESNRHDFQAVLLDRVMPNMDGLEVLKKMKGHPRIQSIPVIMQTAANATDEVLEGIEAGAYYYLTKPYQKKILVGIVQAAIRDFAQQKQLQQDVQQTERTWKYLQSGIFRFRTLQEARELGPLLANGCPDPGRTILGLSEVLVNAVEHGNLAISYEEKGRLEELDQVDSEIERRLELPEYVSKFVEVTFVRRDQAIEITITDQGAGFNWQSYLTLDENRAFDSHGRGIAMAGMLSFDKLEYRGRGNQVVCTINASLQPAQSKLPPVVAATH